MANVVPPIDNVNWDYYHGDYHLNWYAAGSTVVGGYPAATSHAGWGLPPSGYSYPLGLSFTANWLVSTELSSATSADIKISVQLFGTGSYDGTNPILIAFGFGTESLVDYIVVSHDSTYPSTLAAAGVYDLVIPILSGSSIPGHPGLTLTRVGDPSNKALREIYFYAGTRETSLGVYADRPFVFWQTPYVAPILPPPPPAESFSLDFPQSALPGMLPLVNSFDRDTVDAGLKQIFIDLFTDHLAVDAFDTNALGAAHLGSLGLVRKAVGADGLALLQGDRGGAVTRYLYRAWKAGNTQGRGLHFLRTYLQLLFPNDWDIYQLWHETHGADYPDGTHHLLPGYSMQAHRINDTGLKLNNGWQLNKEEYLPDPSLGPDEYSLHHLFLSNRIEITLGLSIDPVSLINLSSILSACIPARFVLVFNFWRNLVITDSGQIDCWKLNDGHRIGDKVYITTTDWITR